MGIQSSINTALGVAAIASGLTNKKQVDKAQDKLDKSEDKLAKTTAEKVNTEGQLANKEKDLAKTQEDLAETKAKKSALEDEKNMQYGLNTFNVSNDLPTANKEITNATNTAGDKTIDNNSIKNNLLGSWIKDYIKYSNQKVNPLLREEFMGLHALKMKDSMVAAKREVRERSRRAMKLDPRTIRALEAKNGGNE